MHLAIAWRSRSVRYGLGMTIVNCDEILNKTGVIVRFVRGVCHRIF